MIDYRGYTGAFEYEREIETFTGHVVDLRDQIHFEGSSIEELKASMARAVDHYLDVCSLRGESPDRPFSGRFNVRLEPALHRDVAVAARLERKSMNEWISETIEQRLAGSR